LKSFASTVKLVAQFISIISNYSFTFVLVTSFQYHLKYLRDVKFDNNYITQYFRHIDARRYRFGKRVLLPLKKYEEQTLNCPFQLLLSVNQRPLIKINLFIHVTILVSLLLTFFIDRFIQDFVLVMRANSEVKFEYKSNKDEQVEVVGEGMFADIARKLTLSINKKSEVDDFQADSSHCLPNVRQVSREQVFVIAKQCGLLVFLSLVEIYVKRFNRNLCAYFYRKWEKKRILWLYNDTLKKRLAFIRNAKKKITFKKLNGLIETEGRLSRLLMDKLQQYKYVVRVLTVMRVLGKRYCVLCSHAKRRTSLQCKTCATIYCIECWFDLGEKCVCCSADFHEEHSWEYDFEL
jgi:hypothetical protein